MQSANSNPFVSRGLDALLIKLHMPESRVSDDAYLVMSDLTIQRQVH